MEVKYEIQHPIAAEILIAGEHEVIQPFCLAALQLAVKEKQMKPEAATDYWESWFGARIQFVKEDAVVTT